MRQIAILLVVAATAATAAVPAAAQQDIYVVRAAPAWLGISYETQWVLDGRRCAPQVIVQAVVHGSPAERAGLQAGDAITAVNGEPASPGRLQAIADRLAPGDSVRLRLRREGSEREVTAIADRRPPRPLSISVERSDFRSGGAPVIEVVGDSLIARDLMPEWDPGRVRGYWIRGADGRAEYRTVGDWSGGELDDRVADLLACADSAGARAPRWGSPGPRVAIGLEELQERADSIRVAITRRAMERQETRDVMRRVDPTLLERSPRTIRITGPEGSYAFRVEEHTALGLRGVAGAELTILEPELAEYFRNADAGLLVLRIAPDTPAGRAGLRPGDVVVAADGRTLESVAELRQVVALPGTEPVTLRVIRKGRTRELTLRRD